MKKLSIKWKAAIAATLFTVAVVVIVSAVQLHFMRRDMTRVIADAQFAMVSRVAEQLDNKLALSMSLLVRSSERIPHDILKSPDAVRNYYNTRQAMLVLFDDIIVLDANGTLLADVPELPERANASAAQRDYFKKVMAEKKPFVYGPFVGRIVKEPLIQIVAPILSGDGDVLAVLIGVNRLKNENLLHDVSAAKIGNKGYFYIGTTGNVPIIVMHPNQSRLLEKVQRGTNLCADSAIAGYEGSCVGLNSSGVHALFSFKSLKMTPWVLGGMVPTDEVYAPIVEAEYRTYAAACIVALIVIPLSWLGAWKLLSPLTNLNQAIQGMLGADKAFVPAKVTTDDEIGEIAVKFNSLMAERASIADNLRASENRMRMVADNMPSLICYFDRQQRYQFANKAFKDWFGLDPEHLIGRTFKEVVPADFFESTLPHLVPVFAGRSTTFTYTMPAQDEQRIVEVTIVPECNGDRVEGAYVLVHDITDLKNIETRLSELVRVDTLTQLPNRFSFNERLVVAIARSERTKAPMALMFLDIDRFKSINDTYGHEMGDKVLQEFAHRVSGAVRTTDTVARLAGDEFVVIVEGLHDAIEANLIAKKILAAFEPEVQLPSGPIKVSTSIGVAIRRTGQLDGDELLRNADSALYVSKQEGRGRYHVG